MIGIKGLLDRREFGYSCCMSEKTETGQQSRKEAIEAQAKLRRERAADKLRENLGRRKQQVRARRSGQADETNGLPAAKLDES